MKKVLFFILAIVMFGCEQPANESLISSFKKNELKQEPFTFNYEGCEIYGKVLPVDALTRGFSSEVKVYDLVVESEYLKEALITQLTQIFNNDGSFTLTHYVEGLKVATLSYDNTGKLYDIEVEEYPSTRVASNFVECFNKKYSSLKKEYQNTVGEFVTDMTINVVAPALAATAAADCAGMFDNVGIK